MDHYLVSSSSDGEPDLSEIKTQMSDNRFNNLTKK